MIRAADCHAQGGFGAADCVFRLRVQFDLILPHVDMTETSIYPQKTARSEGLSEGEDEFLTDVEGRQMRQRIGSNPELWSSMLAVCRTPKTPRIRIPPLAIVLVLLASALSAAAFSAGDSGRVLASQGEVVSQGGAVSERTPDDLEEITNFQNLIEEERFQEVEPLLEAYLSRHPDSWKVQYFRGYVLFRQRRISDAVKALAKSLELNIENAEAHKILGRCLSVIGRFNLAQKEFEEALRLQPGSAAEIHYDLGRVYAAQDDFHGARREFEAAIQLNPTYMEAHNALGFAMEALRDDNAALQSYQNAIRLNEARGGHFEAPYVNLSGFYNRRGQLDLALEYARKAIELNPNSDLAYFQICKAHRVKEEWAQAAEAVGKAIVIRPHVAKYYYVLSIAVRKLGKHDESQRAMQRFHELEKESENYESMRREARRAEQGLEDRIH